MKAFKIHWSKTSDGSPLDLGYKYNIPYIRCPKCGEWGNGDFEYPAFNYGFLNEQEYSDDRILDVGEYNQLIKRIINAAKRQVNMVPGASLGQPYGEALQTNLEDFVWGRICVPQISKRVRDLLTSEGINLLTADIDIRFRGRKIDSHVAIQVEPVPLMTEENLSRFTITHCSVCGDYNQTVCGVVVSEGYQLQKAHWPKGEHLVMLRETLDVIASEEFMDAVEKHNLTGIIFEECGKFV